MFSELSTASQYDLINYLHYGDTEMKNSTYYSIIYKDNHFYSREELAKHTGLFPGSTPCTPIHQCLTIYLVFHAWLAPK